MKFYYLILLLIFTLSCSESVMDKNSSDNPNKEIKTIDSIQVKTIKSDSTNRKNSTNKIITPKGTQLLPESKRTKFVWEMTAYDLVEVIFTDCKSEGEEIYNTKYPIVNEIIHNDSILTIDFNISDECGSNFLCEVELIENTINLIYHQYNAYTSCQCCYGLRYSFNIINEDRLENDPEIEYIMINGKDKTKI